MATDSRSFCWRQQNGTCVLKSVFWLRLITLFGDEGEKSAPRTQSRLLCLVLARLSTFLSSPLTAVRQVANGEVVQPRGSRLDILGGTWTFLDLLGGGWTSLWRFYLDTNFVSLTIALGKRVAYHWAYHSRSEILEGGTP